MLPAGNTKNIGLPLVLKAIGNAIKAEILDSLATKEADSASISDVVSPAIEKGVEKFESRTETILSSLSNLTNDIKAIANSNDANKEDISSSQLPSTADNFVFKFNHSFIILPFQIFLLRSLLILFS